MKLKVIVLDEAEEELSEAHGHYELHCPGLGGEFRLAVDETITRIVEGAAVPIAVPGVEDRTIRRVIVNRFPYSLVFMTHHGEVWILAFAHHHRRPGYWRDRVRP